MDNKLSLINFLGRHPGKSFTIRELSLQSRIPYATLHRTVVSIPELLTKNTIGKAIVVALNPHKEILKHYLIISSEEEKQEYLQTQPLIRKITLELPSADYTALLFGSYAKRTQTAKSDIDLLIINRTGQKNPAFSRYETLFKVSINPIYFTIKEFREMLKSPEENVAKQALNDHIILYNPPLFWGIAYGF